MGQAKYRGRPGWRRLRRANDDQCVLAQPILWDAVGGLVSRAPDTALESRHAGGLL